MDLSDKTIYLFKVINSDELADRLAKKLTAADIKELVAEVDETYEGKFRRRIEHIFESCKTQREQLEKFLTLIKEEEPCQPEQS